MRFRIPLLSIFLLFSVEQLNAQNSTLDSLKLRLAECATVQCRMETYASIGAGYYYLSPDSALAYTELGLQAARNDTSNMDSLYYGSYNALLNNAAFIHQKKGDYYKAIILYQQSIAAYTKLADSASSSSAYLNLATLYNEIGETGAALTAAQAFNRRLNASDNNALAHCQLLLGDIAQQSGKQEEALNHFTSALSFFMREDVKSETAKASCRIGQVYFERRDYRTAESYFRDAYRYATQSMDAEAISLSAYHLATIERKQNKPDSAIYYATMSLENAQNIRFPSCIRNAAFLLYEVYAEKGNTAEALRMHVLYKEQDDILRNQDAVKIATREQLQADFETQQALERAKQERNQLVQEENIHRQKMYTWTAFGAGTLLLLLLIIAVQSYRNKQKSEEQISAQKKLLETKNKEIEDSIVVADRIQRALFPSADVWKKSFPESFVLYCPKDIVSGDFYWTGTFGNYTYAACCDSTGHGVPGAFVSLLNISFINEAITERNITEPGAILDFVRSRLIERLTGEQTNEGMDGILVRFDATQPRDMAYAAAHNRALVIRNEKLHALETDKMPVGKPVVSEKPFATHHFALEKNDLVVLYTDGFADQFGGPGGKKFKYKALDNLLCECASLPCDAIGQSLNTAFVSWKGETEQTDDVLVIGIRA